MASGADDVLAATRIVATLDEALAGVQWSVALSARSREHGQRRLASGEIAFVFGNERVGLSNEHVERCSAIAHIPANPDYSSLNLSQAIQVLAYELRVALLDAAVEPPQAPDGAAGALAQAEDIEKMFAHLETALVAVGFLDPDKPEEADAAAAAAVLARRAGARGGQYPARHRQAHPDQVGPRGALKRRVSGAGRLRRAQYPRRRWGQVGAVSGRARVALQSAGAS
ncbi:MAG: tRNA (cytidine/uridine-2'-O-)-methyltransferase TrmJ [Burkholderia gladioli]|nr:MAG: tRNA (cytidine/uridine-2'-O-)-methyltransferase TrmJ [Burkholderia gladioli]